MSDIENSNNNQAPAKQTVGSVWAGLSRNARIALVAVAAVIVFAIGGAGGGTSSPTPTTDTVPTTISVSDQWLSWKASFMPVVSQTESHYNQTVADLNAYDEVAVSADFALLAQDADEWLSYANSPNATINADIRQSSIHLKEITSTGIAVLNGSPNIAAFTAACEAWGKATDKLATDLETANSLY